MNKFLLSVFFGLLILSTSSSSLRNLNHATCGQYDANGNCLICSHRYVMVEGQCKKVSDDCKFWDQNGACTECWPRSYVNNGVCVRVSDLCQTWDSSTGLCLSCYSGSNLENGACIFPSSEHAGQVDPNAPPTCYYRQVLIGGVCVNVSVQCQTWDWVTADCLSCYGGFWLVDGDCVLL